MNEGRIIYGARTCKVCVKNEVCKYFDRMEKLIADLPHHGSPGNEADFYVVLANNCLQFREKKIIKNVKD